MTDAAHARAVIVMAKRPAPGKTKTRLTPALSPEQAADLYACLLHDTLNLIEAREDCIPVIAIDTPAASEYFSRIAPGVDQVVQQGAALGDRLDSVMAECLHLGHPAVFAISSDSPDLPTSHLDDAFASLDRDDVDVVLGPTEDGGYYLIGWKQRWSRLVTEVTMSTPQVLEDTLAIASELEAQVHLAPSWYDIDTPDDLRRLRNATGARQLRSVGYLAEIDRS